MYIARRLAALSCVLPALLVAGAVRAQAPDPAALQAAIAGARLDPVRAVTLKNVKLGVGLGKLSLDDGVLIPATAVGGKTIEMVFLGKGRIEVEPPDAIEAGQLELFTGGSRLDEEFKEAVLVAGGAPLFFLRNGGELTVVLPQAPPSGGTASVVIEYSGRPVDKDWNLFTLLDTMGWYPHAGAVDRAPYDVTFHWPKGLELVSSGHRMDGGKGKGKDGANATVKGNILVKGESTPFEIPVASEPKGFWMDRHAKVFGLFFDENRHPRRTLIYQGVRAAINGKPQEAVAFYDKAMTTEEPPSDSGETVYYQNIQLTRRVMNGQIELGRARLLLDGGKDDEADAALGRVDRLLKDGEEYKILQSRLDVRRGDYDKAFQRLRKGLKSAELDSSEGFALLAISAQATGHKEELGKALKKARENGADVSLLAGS